MPRFILNSSDQPLTAHVKHPTATHQITKVATEIISRHDEMGLHLFATITFRERNTCKTKMLPERMQCCILFDSTTREIEKLVGLRSCSN